MSINDLPIRGEFRTRFIGSNLNPLSIRVPHDLTGGSAVVDMWNAETSEQKVDAAACTITGINITAPWSTVNWAPSLADLDTEGDYLLLYKITSGGNQLKVGLFRFAVRRDVAPF